MKDHRARLYLRLALWLLLTPLATVVVAACARDRGHEPSSAYLAVRAQSARPPSARLSPPPGPMAVFAGWGPELRAPTIRRAESVASAPDPRPRPATLRHEYPRGPPRA